MTVTKMIFRHDGDHGDGFAGVRVVLRPGYTTTLFLGNVDADDNDDDEVIGDLRDQHVS